MPSKTESPCQFGYDKIRIALEITMLTTTINITLFVFANHTLPTGTFTKKDFVKEFHAVLYTFDKKRKKCDGRG